MTDVGALLAQHELTPNVLPDATGTQLLPCIWDGIRVEPGQKMSVRNLKNAPRFAMKVDPEATFSLVMIDPDNLSREKPTVAEWLQWLVINIPASNVIEGINGGMHQQAYGSPAPGPRTGQHRYLIVLFEHAGRRLQVPKPTTRAKFSLKAFVEKHKLGAPLAANFFYAEHEG